MEIGGGEPLGDPPQRRYVIENPERAAVRRGDEVVVLDDEVVHRGGRQIELQRLPVGAIVRRVEDAQFGARIQQSLANRVFAYRVHVGAVRYAGSNTRPRLAEIVSPVDQWLQIVELVAIDGGVGRTRIVRRRIDQTHHAPRRHVLWSDVLPCLAIIPSQMNEAIIGTGPQQSLLARRLGEREYGVVVLDAGDVERDRAAGGLLFALVVAGQIRTDDLPGASLVGAAYHELRRRVEHVRIMQRDEQRLGPLQAELQVRRAVARHVERVHGYVARVVRAMIVPRHLAAVGVRIHHFRILGIRRDETALAAPDLVPILAADDSVIVTARDRNGGVVLLRAVHAIGPAVVDGHMIKLRRRLIIWRSPRLAFIHGDARAAVAAVYQSPRILRIHP